MGWDVNTTANGDIFTAEGNKGGDFLQLEMISKDNNDDIIRFRVVHCCVSYVEAELPVAVLTGILAEYFQHEKNIQKLFKENVNWPEDYKQKLLELINDG